MGNSSTNRPSRINDFGRESRYPMAFGESPPQHVFSRVGCAEQRLFDRLACRLDFGQRSTSGSSLTCRKASRPRQQRSDAAETRQVGVGRYSRRNEIAARASSIIGTRIGWICDRRSIAFSVRAWNRHGGQCSKKRLFGTAKTDFRHRFSIGCGRGSGCGWCNRDESGDPAGESETSPRKDAENTEDKTASIEIQCNIDRFAEWRRRNAIDERLFDDLYWTEEAYVRFRTWSSKGMSHAHLAAFGGNSNSVLLVGTRITQSQPKKYRTKTSLAQNRIRQLVREKIHSANFTFAQRRDCT